MCQNYWLNLKEGSLNRKGKKLDLDSAKWLKLVQPMGTIKNNKSGTVCHHLGPKAKVF